MGMSTWTVPRDSGAVFAIGTERTCNIQAFFIFMCVSSVLYNASLSFYFLLVIRFGWKDRSINRIEPLLHGLPLLWGIGTGLTSYFMNAFSYSDLWCWIGEDFEDLRVAFMAVPLVFTMVVIVINSYLNWRHV